MAPPTSGPITMPIWPTTSRHKVSWRAVVRSGSYALTRHDDSNQGCRYTGSALVMLRAVRAWQHTWPLLHWNGSRYNGYGTVLDPRSSETGNSSPDDEHVGRSGDTADERAKHEDEEEDEKNPLLTMVSKVGPLERRGHLDSNFCLEVRIKLSRQRLQGGTGALVSPVQC